MQKYYGLYDLQLEGFKAGYVGVSYEEVLNSGAERVYTLSQTDEEPVSNDMSDEDMLEEYGYEVREISEKIYEEILNSVEYGLLKVVELK